MNMEKEDPHKHDQISLSKSRLRIQFRILSNFIGNKASNCTHFCLRRSARKSDEFSLSLLSGMNLAILLNSVKRR